MSEHHVMVDDEGREWVVRDSTLNARSDYMLYATHPIRREYDHGVLCYEAERRKHGLVRVWQMESEWDADTDHYRGSIRYF